MHKAKLGLQEDLDEDQTLRQQMGGWLMCMMKSTYSIGPMLWLMSGSLEGVNVFSISKTFCSAASTSPDNFHSSAMHFSWHLQARCHYQKGLDFSGMTFRSWVRYTVSTSQGVYRDRYLFSLRGNVRKTELAEGKQIILPIIMIIIINIIAAAVYILL